MKTIKMFSVNGAWYPKTRYGRKLLRVCGLSNGGFLSLSLVAKHCLKFNVQVIEVKP